MRFCPGVIAPTPGNVTVMTAEGSKDARRDGTMSAPVKWASIAAISSEVSLVDWALTREPRKKRAKLVEMMNMAAQDEETLTPRMPSGAHSPYVGICCHLYKEKYR